MAAPPTRRVGLSPVLVLVGSALVVVGCVLTWASFPTTASAPELPDTIDGFTRFRGASNDGPIFAGLAGVLAILAVGSVILARRLAVLVPALAVAGFGAAAAVIDYLDVRDPAAFPAAMRPDVGPGLPVVIAGFAVAVAGIAWGLLRPRQ